MGHSDWLSKVKPYDQNADEHNLDSKQSGTKIPEPWSEQSGGITNFGREFKKASLSGSQFGRRDTNSRVLVIKIARQIEAELENPMVALIYPTIPKNNNSPYLNTTIGKVRTFDESSTLSIVINVDVNASI
ncbi:hypothetical protein FQR65_LT19847 [Abscondita terminalis]|nr:hypothetical protein FQR65_LT19847 [Abscondita terminalis]